MDNATAQAFGEPFARSAYLRALLAGHGLVPGFPLVWPGNASFPQLLDEVAGEPLARAGTTGFAVNVGAGDGKRQDIYHKPMDPIYPLLERGYGGLAVEVNRRYGGDAHTNLTEASVPMMAFASGNLPAAMAEVNRSGNVHIAWAAATPETIGPLLKAYTTPIDFDALNLDLDGDELPVLKAILESGFQPKTIALNFNPDLPPPIRLHLTSSLSHHSKLSAAAIAHGLSSTTADAAFALLSPRWSLVGVTLGRFSRWCQKCEQRMWYVRSDLLPGLAPHRPLLAWRDMTRMFWGGVYASVEMPKMQAGKLLAHSTTYVCTRARAHCAHAPRASATHPVPPPRTTCG